MKRKPSLRDRREFIRGVTVASLGSAVALHTTAHHMAVRHSKTISLATLHGRSHPRVLSCIMHCPVVGDL